MQPKTIQDIEDYFNQNDLFNKYGLTKIGVFGSFARGEKFNDIDLYIEDDIDENKLLYLQKILQYYWDIKVDIVPKKYADPIILHRALKDMIYVS